MEFMLIPGFCALCLLSTVILVLPIHCARGSSSIENSLEPNQEHNNIVKTIKSEYGDIYDCIGLYKQPAFDHPLLKHHKIQMKPSFALKNKELEKNSSSSNSLLFGLKEACPSGTVPIRRVTQEEKIRAEAAFLQHSQLFSSSSPQNDPAVLAFAGVSTDFPMETTVYGGGGYVSTHNPTVDTHQASASVISLERGHGDHFATIRIGWMVYPALYKDNRTRLYALWSQISGGGKGQGCFNTYCPGFIQTNPKIPLDMVLDNISGPGGRELYIAQELTLEDTTGNWWYHFGENDDPVGYWPPGLFNELQYGAKVIKWGGMVVTNSQILPDMGSGELEDPNGSHFRKLSGIYNESFTNTTSSLEFKNGSQNEQITLLLIQTNCYRVGGASDKPDPYWGYSFWFGGKGGDVQQCKS